MLVASDHVLGWIWRRYCRTIHSCYWIGIFAKSNSQDGLYLVWRQRGYSINFTLQRGLATAFGSMASPLGCLLSFLLPNAFFFDGNYDKKARFELYLGI